MRYRILGLAGASLWLIWITFGFVAYGLYAIDTPAGWLWLAGAIAATLALTERALNLIHEARALPRLGYRSAAEQQEGRAMTRGFLITFAAELAGWAIVMRACAGYPDMIPALCVGVVGLHFIPLAPIFRVPGYYTLGLHFCSIAAITLLLIPENEVIGHVRLWWVFPSLATVPVIAAVAWGNLTEAVNELAALHAERRAA